MPYGKTGIQNSGNTCFINSIIQCLSHTVGLTKYLITEEYKKNNIKNENDFILEYHNVLRSLWGNNDNVIDILELKKLICKYSRDSIDFRGNNQCDADEFLGFFLDTIHNQSAYSKIFTITGDIKSINDEIITKSYQQYITEFEKNYSKIVELFYGQYHSILIFPEFEYQSIKFDLYLAHWYISCYIPVTYKWPKIENK